MNKRIFLITAFTFLILFNANAASKEDRGESKLVEIFNPKAGVDGLIPLIGLALSSAFAYRQIKR